MKINITYDKDDWTSYLSSLKLTHLNFDKFWEDNLWILLSITAIGIIILIIWIIGLIDFHWQTALTVAIILILYFFVILFSLDYPEPNPDGVFRGTHTFHFTSEGIEIHGDGFSSNYSWKVVKEITDQDSMILIYIDSIQALFFPKNKLKNPMKFYSFVKELHVNSNGGNAT